ncbi:unnamed protein product [Bursaphelenchus okinawaensis]|uniref:Uncharacterized protein n=1 Tax=Bursaphelenchus okinawaensis TaxID=465554 RepID=A0A811L8B9_9BILA|nr:unnamed protein product [Bursaphelenchus okinawaensis]CAG9117729.1 unnamed protein product [Bursaphelenchus okinawaensis]
MFFGSYFIGFLPLLGNLGESKIRMVSVFGAGLLIGTAFVVVIPEGIDAVQRHVETPHESLDQVLAKETNANSVPLDKPTLEKSKPPPPDTLKTGKEEHHDHHEENGKVIGFVILLGFLFMLIVDQVSKTSCGGGRRKLSTTIGLCVHALADGVLMGSASSTSNNEVQMVVFFALIIHKGPAAFALTSLLMLEKLERPRIKRHLMIFSLSAPLGAYMTYFFLAAVKEGANYSSNLSGMFMLFSAGTFLYVAAAHVLPELESSENHHSSSGHQLLSTGPQGISIKELIVILIGAFAPCILFTHHKH